MSNQGNVVEDAQQMSEVCGPFRPDSPDSPSSDAANGKKCNRVEDDQQMSEDDEFGLYWPHSPSAEAVEKRNKYNKLLAASEGFYSDVWEILEFEKEFSPACDSILPLYPDSVLAREIGKHVLQIFNKSKGKNLAFRRLVRANEAFANGFMFYLTFEASDECFYEAKVFFPPSFEREDIEVEFVRLAVHYPEVQIPSWWGKEPVPADNCLPKQPALPYLEDEDEFDY